MLLGSKVRLLPPNELLLSPILTNLVILGELRVSSGCFPFDLLVYDCSVSSSRVGKGPVGVNEELMFDLVTVPRLSRTAMLRRRPLPPNTISSSCR